MSLILLCNLFETNCEQRSKTHRIIFNKHFTSKSRDHFYDVPSIDKYSKRERERKNNWLDSLQWRMCRKEKKKRKNWKLKINSKQNCFGRRDVFAISFQVFFFCFSFFFFFFFYAHLEIEWKNNSVEPFNRFCASILWLWKEPHNCWTNRPVCVCVYVIEYFKWNSGFIFIFEGSECAQIE